MTETPDRTSRARGVTMAALACALATTCQLLGLPRLMTGVVINSLFIVTLHAGGLNSALLLTMLTPCTALIAGIIPPPFVPLLPLIALSNALLVLVYNSYKEASLWRALLFPTVAKTFVLALCYGALSHFLGLAAKGGPLVALFTTIQFVAALGGIALGRSLSTRLPFGAC